MCGAAIPISVRLGLLGETAIWAADRKAELTNRERRLVRDLESSLRSRHVPKRARRDTDSVACELAA
jgi:hypothetical protein